MARIYPVVVKRATTVINVVAGNVTNWLARATPAARVTLVGRFLVTERPASSQRFAPARLLVAENPASAQTQRNSGVLVKPVAKPAPAVTQRNSGTVRLPEASAGRLTVAPARLLVAEKPAGNLVQASFDLVHRSFVVSMTNDTANTRAWTNPTNAQGANDAVNATWDGSLAIAQTGAMHGTTVAQNNRPASLLIDAVYMAVWGSWSGLPVVDDLLSGLSVGYRIGGITATDVQTLRRGVSSGSDAGTEIRIDDGAGKFTDAATPALSTAVTWANIALLQLWAKGTTLVGVASTFNIDALRLRVLAHEVQAL